MENFVVETHYKQLVTEAQNKRNKQITNNQQKPWLSESFQDSASELEVLAQEIKSINEYITVDDTVFDDASSDYEKIAKKLVEKLQWPDQSIQIIPQGSASTRTLIRSPDNSKFDIDAVCSVDLSMTELKEPMEFYKKVGEALANWNPEAKKRCWKIDFNGRRYYIEFTPSTPLDKVPQSSSEYVSFTPSARYSDTALAVVDTPTQKWKTSNPKGFSKWVSDQASKPLLSWLINEGLQDSHSSASVTPVQEQNVSLSDTLRIAIRLLKRHRDMSVRRNYIEPELKPISIIIVTLLTQCYEGLVNNGATYNHPIKLLIDLVELMPHMIETRNNQLWVANPTVDGENFAEKWNNNPKLQECFNKWATFLLEDLNTIMSNTDETSRRDYIKQIFGCTTSHTPTPTNSGGGLAPRKPTQPHKAPPTKGLA